MRHIFVRSLTLPFLVSFAACSAAGTESSADAGLDASGFDAPPESATPSETGPDAGACAPGTKSCDGLTPLTCAASGTYRRGAPCAFACVSGVCTGECVPGTTACDGKTPLTCVSGQWQRGAACAALCVSGSCAETCTTGARQCSGSIVVECASGTAWDSVELCPYACDGGRCVGCTPGALRCSADGRTPEMCGADGTWRSGEACAGSCVDGSCSEQTCATGATQCSGASVLGCETGAWKVLSSCENVCLAGACGGACKPGAARCNASNTALQFCDKLGQWSGTEIGCAHGCDGKACRAATPPEPQPEAGSEPQPEPQVEAGSEPQPEPQPEPQVEAGSEPQPEPQPEPQVEAGSEPQPEPQAEAGSDPGPDGGDADAGPPRPLYNCAVVPGRSRKLSDTTSQINRDMTMVPTVSGRWLLAWSEQGRVTKLVEYDPENPASVLTWHPAPATEAEVFPASPVAGGYLLPLMVRVGTWGNWKLGAYLINEFGIQPFENLSELWVNSEDSPPFRVALFDAGGGDYGWIMAQQNNVSRDGTLLAGRGSALLPGTIQPTLTSTSEIRFETAMVMPMGARTGVLINQVETNPPTYQHLVVPNERTIMASGVTLRDLVSSSSTGTYVMGASPTPGAPDATSRTVMAVQFPAAVPMGADTLLAMATFNVSSSTLDTWQLTPASPTGVSLFAGEIGGSGNYMLHTHQGEVQLLHFGSSGGMGSNFVWTGSRGIIYGRHTALGSAAGLGNGPLFGMTRIVSAALGAAPATLTAKRFPVAYATDSGSVYSDVIECK